MKNFFTSFCVTLAITFSVVAVYFSADTKNNISDENPTKYSAEYKIAEHSGKLAIYKNDSAVPVKIYNIYLENLPESDRQEIKKGITCKDDAELRRLIEDYTS